MDTKIDARHVCWIPAEGECIEGDIIRWHEPVYFAGCRNALRKIGSRTITAQILELRGGYFELVTLRCEVTSRTSKSFMAVEAVDTEISRKREAILEARPVRMLWRDESIRALLTSGRDCDLERLDRSTLRQSH